MTETLRRKLGLLIVEGDVSVSGGFGNVNFSAVASARGIRIGSDVDGDFNLDEVAVGSLLRDNLGIFSNRRAPKEEVAPC